MGFDYVFKVPRKGKGGGIMVLWSNDLKVFLRSFNVEHDNMMVDIQYWELAQVTGFFGNHKKFERHHSLNLP